MQTQESSPSHSLSFSHGQSYTIQRGGLTNTFTATFNHTLLHLLRRKRILLAGTITLLPVLLPLTLAFFSHRQFGDDGAKTFVLLAERLHINILAPLLALFFATMLIGEDIENQTIAYILVRPLSRTAWLLGRFLGYLLVTFCILLTSLILTYTACTSLNNFGFILPDLKILLHYSAIALIALIAYGALALFLGLAAKRPIIYGALLLYGWQKIAMLVPGLIDFLTFQKYIEALLPKLAGQRHSIEVHTVLGTFQKEIFAVQAGSALLVLLCSAILLLSISVIIVRYKEHTRTKAIGG